MPEEQAPAEPREPQQRGSKYAGLLAWIQGHPWQTLVVVAGVVIAGLVIKNQQSAAQQSSSSTQPNTQPTQVGFPTSGMNPAVVYDQNGNPIPVTPPPGWWYFGTNPPTGVGGTAIPVTPPQQGTSATGMAQTIAGENVWQGGLMQPTTPGASGVSGVPGVHGAAPTQPIGSLPPGPVTQPPPPSMQTPAVTPTQPIGGSPIKMTNKPIGYHYAVGGLVGPQVGSRVDVPTTYPVPPDSYVKFPVPTTDPTKALDAVANGMPVDHYLQIHAPTHLGYPSFDASIFPLGTSAPQTRLPFPNMSDSLNAETVKMAEKSGQTGHTQKSLAREYQKLDNVSKSTDVGVHLKAAMNITEQPEMSGRQLTARHMAESGVPSVPTRG